MNRKQISPTLLNSDPKALQSIDFKSGQTYYGKGFIPFSQLPRLAEELMLEKEQLDSLGLQWQAETWISQQEGAPDQYRLQIEIHAEFPLICQRCTHVYIEKVESFAQFLMLDTEEELDAFPLDEESEDVLLNSKHFNLFEVLEDEGILSLPLMPKHPEGECIEIDVQGKNASSSAVPVELDLEDDISRDTEKRPNPFAVLKSLKDKK